jgi:predicted short-subunit dehydrogenase-like oxidoreductase (DUF2520 family)
MRIVSIGSGNIAHFFISRLQKKGHEVVQVYSPNYVNALTLANWCNITNITSELSKIITDADAYILAIKDDALPEIAQKLRFPGKVVIHCAGAVSLDVMEEISEHRAVIWSLYSIKKQHLPAFKRVPLVVEANTHQALHITQSLAKDISEKVLVTSFEQRQYLHLNAVLVNNFNNHLLTIAQKLSEAHQLPFDILLPIIRQTYEQTTNNLPSENQTGPAVRSDEDTIAKHLNLLAPYPEWQKVYEQITHSIQHSQDY